MLKIQPKCRDILCESPLHLGFYVKDCVSPVAIESDRPSKAEKKPSS